MAMLHTVNKSPFDRNSLESCLRLSKPGSSVFLYEDGVYGALNGTSLSDKVSAALSDRSVYVLLADFKARGLSEDRLIEGVKAVADYSGFVDLVAEHSNVQAWL